MKQDLLKRYLNNTATPEEAEEVREWLLRQEHEQEALDHITAAWETFEPGNTAAYRHAIPPAETLMAMAGKRVGGDAKLVRMYRLSRKWAGIAAACIAFLLTGIAIGYRMKGRNAPPEIYYAVTATQKGQHTQLMLSDGSEIYLTGNSRLTYPIRMDMQQTVYLEGEADFDVQDREKPLMVKTRELITTGNGSRFSIKAFPRDSTVTIAVKKGKAEIQSNQEVYPMLDLYIPARQAAAKQDSSTTAAQHSPFMKLLPPIAARENEYATYNKRQKVISIYDQQEGKEILIWKDGELRFQQADTTMIRNKLESWFGVNVKLQANGAPLPPYTAAFCDASLELVLQQLSTTLDLEYRIDGRNVYLVKHK